METIVVALLLLVHVGGAIVGFGPTFTFAILGAVAGKAGPNGGAAVLEAMVAIEKRLILPVAVVTQPLSGITLIFVAGFASDFLRHYWLVAGIVLYAIALYISIFIQLPAIERMLELAKAGPPTPEMATLARRTQRNGPIVTALLGLIIVLMITKPLG